MLPIFKKEKIVIRLRKIFKFWENQAFFPLKLENGWASNPVNPSPGHNLESFKLFWVRWHLGQKHQPHKFNSRTWG